MDVEPRAKAELLKQIWENGGTLTITTSITHPVMRRYLRQLADAGRLLEIEWTPATITYQLPEQEQDKAA